MLGAFPLILVAVVLYNLLVFGGGAAGHDTMSILSQNFTIHLFSGDGWKITLGDLFLAFSTANAQAVAQHEGVVASTSLGEAAMSRFYEATIQAVEEAILNSMFAAETMTGVNGFTVRALPVDQVREILARYNRLVPVD